MKRPPNDTVYMLPSRPLMLIVEDEIIIAMHIEDILLDLGFSVVKAARVAKALHIIENETIAGAFLDVSVFGSPVFPLADALTAGGIPFVFVTGCASQQISEQYPGSPVLSKPIIEYKVGAAAADFLRYSCRSSGPSRLSEPQCLSGF